ncbi:MAG: excinuclease ABC subunit A, partial [Acidobacteriota bacterium]
MSRKKTEASGDRVIRLRGVTQHNLKNIDLDIPLSKLIAVSGVSGSGKSSLALHTLYAEGQRRYIETFSAYARQFLERMDPPKAELIEGIPPSIAIESGTSVRSSRSTVGTITEINDHLKLLFARLAVPHCPKCGEPVREDNPETVLKKLQDIPEGSRVLVAFPYSPEDPANWARHLVSQGFLRIYADGGTIDIEALQPKELKRLSEGEVLVVVDRLPWGRAAQDRVVDSLSTAYRMGVGRIAVIVLPDEIRRFSSDLSCSSCGSGVVIPPPTPNLFSFNSPLGACSECRGFGRIIGVDLDLVIPNRRLTLLEGAVKPWSTDRDEYHDLIKFCRREGIPVDVPYEELREEDKRKIVHGAKRFYGVMGFFDWLETKKYKMHVRVFLSRYRAYTTCPSCSGTRYQPATALYRLRGATIGELSAWSIEKCREFFGGSWPELDKDPAAALLAGEIRSRLEFLRAVGLEYLSLDRQSRTLSGGEVQRVHLTRALGSALVNVLYVLDEPSVGLHARDQKRLMGQLRRLVGQGNSVVVVEHDPDMIRFCDEVIDMGPGGGERGGEVIYQGPPEGLAKVKKSLTGAYLGDGFASAGSRKRSPDWDNALVLKNARENNLKDVTARFPLGLLVGVSGVSGSGKSTLIDKTLYYNWLRETGRATDAPGACDGLEGADLIDEIVLVDQQPIGRTPRANLLTYTKTLDVVRKLQ